ncbi:MAG: DUF3299 domain-containing protein [Endozoicomonas sp. (ex Botrylloides leachii)]|nr:DUF3299 domain-containing protein [Endozoicomonas sp. (ex Botrylloides leachii)]
MSKKIIINSNLTSIRRWAKNANRWLFAACALAFSAQILATQAPSKQAIHSPLPSQPVAKEISWDELMPPLDQTVVKRYQAGEMKEDEIAAYLDKLGLTVVTTVDNTYGKIPGYLVPLNMNKDQIATELLLVPTMGACIHVPPPPPNQIVYIAYPKGIKVTETAYTPYWVVGTLKVEKKGSKYSDTLYTMSVQKIIEYE